MKKYLQRLKDSFMDRKKRIIARFVAKDRLINFFENKKIPFTLKNAIMDISEILREEYIVLKDKAYAHPQYKNIIDGEIRQISLLLDLSNNNNVIRKRLINVYAYFRNVGIIPQLVSVNYHVLIEIIKILGKDSSVMEHAKEIAKLLGFNDLYVFNPKTKKILNAEERFRLISRTFLNNKKAVIFEVDERILENVLQRLKNIPENSPFYLHTEIYKINLLNGLKYSLVIYLPERHFTSKELLESFFIFWKAGLQNPFVFEKTKTGFNLRQQLYLAPKSMSDFFKFTKLITEMHNTGQISDEEMEELIKRIKEN